MWEEAVEGDTTAHQPTRRHTPVWTMGALDCCKLVLLATVALIVALAKKDALHSVLIRLYGVQMEDRWPSESKRHIRGGGEVDAAGEVVCPRLPNCTRFWVEIDRLRNGRR